MTKNKKSVNYCYILFLFCFIGFLPTPTLANESAHQLTIEGPTSVIKEGYFNVSVSAKSEQQKLDKLTIEVATDANFTENQKQFPALGDFSTISLTGFSNGSYHLRARAETESGESLVSNVIQVTVKHYPLWQALTLFFIGLIIFVAVVTTLLLLHRKWTHSRHHSHD